MRSRLVAGGTSQIVLDRLSDPVSGAYENTATVTATVSDDAGPLAGLEALDVPYATGTDGRYVATVDASLTADLAPGDLVDVELWAELADGAVMPFRTRVRVASSA